MAETVEIPGGGTTLLPRLGTLTYSDGDVTIVFGPTDDATISSSPTYDRSGRVVSTVEHTLSVRSWVSADAGTDTTFERMRRVLLHPAGQLVAEIGFGFLKINTADGVFDARWGPKPKLMSFKPLGQAAAKVEWQVTFSLVNCWDNPQNSLDPNKALISLLQANYRMTTQVDQSGYSTRTISGILEIPQTRRGPRDLRLRQTADQYRNLITPPPLRCFRRKQQTVNVSDDKCSITFTFVDEQMNPNLPPPGVIDVQANHEIRNTAKVVATNGMIQWQGILTADYEVDVQFPRSDCLNHFVALLRQRTQNLFRAGNQNFAGAAVGGPQWLLQVAGGGRVDRAAILRGLRINEPIYGRRSGTISGVWTFLSSVQDIVLASGLWTPTGVEWEVWSGELKNTAFHNRGIKKLANLPKHDKLVDPCAKMEVELPPANAPAPPPRLPDAQVLINEMPEPEISWLQWIAWITIEVKDQTVEHKPLPPKSDPVIPVDSGALDLRTWWSNFLNFSASAASLGRSLSESGSIGSVAESVGGFSITSGAFPNLSHIQKIPIAQGGAKAGAQAGIVQVTAQPRIELILHGYAVRAGHPIAVPLLKEVDGVKATPANDPRKGDHFTTGMIEIWFGIPIHYASWKQRYVVPVRPDNLDVPDLF